MEENTIELYEQAKKVIAVNELKEVIKKCSLPLRDLYNTKETRELFVLLCDEYTPSKLKEEYYIEFICDESNNPPSVINNCSIRIDCRMQPKRYISKIYFDMTFELFESFES